MSAQVTTSVGNYPVAPDTSTGAFFAANPDYNTTRYRRLLVNGPKSNGISYARYAKVKGAYDSWAMKLSNQYDSDIKNWEAAYKSPYNQSELLEAAGYNRNWLQGSVNSGVDAGNPIGFTPSDSMPARSTFGDIFGNVVGAAMQGIQGYAQIRDTLASSQLKEAQANQINELTPFKVASRYFDVLPQYNDWYGLPISEADPETGITPAVSRSFGITPSSSITIHGTTDEVQSRKLRKYALDFAEINLGRARLAKEFQNLSNREKRYFVDNLQPIQKEIMDKQKQLLDGQITIQDFEKVIKQKEKEVYVKYAGKKEFLNLFSGWAHLGLDAVKAGMDVYGTLSRGSFLSGSLEQRQLNDEFNWLDTYTGHTGRGKGVYKDWMDNYFNY